VVWQHLSEKREMLVQHLSHLVGRGIYRVLIDINCETTNSDKARDKNPAQHEPHESALSAVTLLRNQSVALASLPASLPAVTPRRHSTLRRLSNESLLAVVASK
jgi:hypothetical protein